MFLWQYWVCSRLIKDAEKYPMIFQHSSALRIYGIGRLHFFQRLAGFCSSRWHPSRGQCNGEHFFPISNGQSTGQSSQSFLISFHPPGIHKSSASAETRVKPLRQHCADDDGRTCRARSSTWSRLPAAWHGWFRSHCDHIWYLLPPGWNFS